jgi:hypothetical protein
MFRLLLFSFLSAFSGLNICPLVMANDHNTSPFVASFGEPLLVAVCVLIAFLPPFLAFDSDDRRILGRTNTPAIGPRDS